MRMAETASTTHITEVALVIVPVSDQDRAIEFYVETLGFEHRADFRYGEGERWVEVAPPGATTRVALVSSRDGQAAGIETRVTLSTEDVDADQAVMHAGDPIVHWGGAALAGVPAMFLFRDPDGNSFLMVQQS
jgi:predicted enzyme related to lactoylglutathione lyase